MLVDAISKSLAATGLRVGWALAHPAVTARLSDLLGHVGAWAPKPEQVATAGFLSDPHAFSVQELIEGRSGQVRVGPAEPHQRRPPRLAMRHPLDNSRQRLPLALIEAGWRDDRAPVLQLDVKDGTSRPANRLGAEMPMARRRPDSMCCANSL